MIGGAMGWVVGRGAGQERWMERMLGRMGTREERVHKRAHNHREGGQLLAEGLQERGILRGERYGERDVRLRV